MSKQNVCKKCSWKGLPDFLFHDYSIKQNIVASWLYDLRYNFYYGPISNTCRYNFAAGVWILAHFRWFFVSLLTPANMNTVKSAVFDTKVKCVSVLLQLMNPSYDDSFKRKKNRFLLRVENNPSLYPIYLSGKRRKHVELRIHITIFNVQMWYLRTDI